MSSLRIRIATRESPLALWQANHVKAVLLAHHGDLDVEIVPMTTRGDQILDSPLAKVGGKGLFVKELEKALLENRADIAVHSMKDVPMEFPEGLGLTVIGEREDPSDAFVSNAYKALGELPAGARVGTSSFRRQCQLKHWRPDLEILDLRGNVGTRLSRLDAGNYDAVILASAGLLRLGEADRIQQRLDFDDSLPAAGQGAIGVECRTDDLQTLERVDCLHHPQTAACVQAERAVVIRLQGGCQVPMASFAQLTGAELYLRALVGTVDGRQIIRARRNGDSRRAEAIGMEVAEDLLEQGAEDILAALEQ